MKDRNHFIDLLRIIAATMVVFFHFNERVPYIDNFYRSILKLGWLGVPIFFVISGYCILLTANASKNAIDFLIRRIFRIYPGYWFSLGIVLSVIGIHKYQFGVNDITVLPKDINSILSTLILNIGPISKVAGINWVYWSLACEMCFYLIVAIGLVFSRKYLPLFVIFFLAASILINDISKGNWYYFLKDWPCFCLGVGIFYLHSTENKNNLWWGSTLLLVTVFAIFIQNPISNLANKQYLIIAFGAAIIIYVSKYLKMESNLLSSFGDYSYALYLVHVPLGVYGLGLLKKGDFETNVWMNIGLDIINFLLVFLISVFIYKYIESPCIKFGKKAFSLLR